MKKKQIRYDITLNGKTFYRRVFPSIKAERANGFRWECSTKGGATMLFHNLKEVRAYAKKLSV